MKKLIIFVLIGGQVLAVSSFALVKKKRAAAKPSTLIAAPTPPPRQVETEKPRPEPTFFGEAGLGGGALVMGLGYGNNFSDKLRYSSRIGYGLGNGYNVVILDFGQLSYNMRTYFLGIGLNYVMYSSGVQDVPGLFGQITNKNLIGLEMVIGRRFGDITGRLGYSTALGIRLSAGYGF